ncbi:endophilin-A isoform X2 [Folsomia candida]|uniref:endophilin-A isoform X2 n=1 Tax=Folsomia candida TaxID=158441 RepID=UPI000B906444|nr:endophilin-A isoform X2 [Folsomia candida]
MAFSGLRKQINKANQYMTEKIGGVEGTRLDDDFMEMEKKTDVTCELVEELQLKTREYLQPNPTARAKMAAVKGISKLSGQAKASTYPQPEGVLGECMSTYGRKLGEDSVFAQALIEAGESLKQMADNKYALDDNVKQNFLEPLHHLQTKDLKEVMHHRKKLQGRRLDFDCKKRKQSKDKKITDDEIRLAEDKFAESLHLAQMGMYNLLENDIEQVSQLAMFTECLLEYHKQCTEILTALCSTLEEKKEEAASRPKKEFTPKTVHDLQLNLDGTDSLSDHIGSKDTLNGTTPQRSPLPSPGNPKREWEPLFSGNNPPKSDDASPIPSPMKSSGTRTPVVQGPSCQALYDFDPENPGELGFKERDMIQLVSRIDENWYEGCVNGKTGFFPVSYVQILVPLPQ